MSITPQNDAQFIKRLEDFALSATKAIGSIWSLIIHTILFLAAFSLTFFGISFQTILLVVTTILSLEAIYLSIFIQMSVNRNTQSIASVEKDIDEIQEDVEEIAEDVEHIEEHVEEIAEDMEEIQEDMEEIAEDVEEIKGEDENKATAVSL